MDESESGFTLMDDEKAPQGVQPQRVGDVAVETKIVNLTYGPTEISWVGDWEANKDKPVVLMFHGFSLPSTNLYRTLAPRIALSNGGLRVVHFSLYGSGRSPWPDNVAGTAELYVQQAYDVITHVLGDKTQPKFYLVGMSMGGALAVRYTEIHPTHVERLVLLSPAGLPVNKPFTAKLVLLPCLGDCLYAMVGKGEMVKSAANDYSDQKRYAHFIKNAEDEIKKQIAETPGYMDALLSRLRYFPLGELYNSYKAIGTHERPVLLVWGDDDNVCPFANAKTALELMPRCKLVQLEGAGHCAHIEQEDETVDAITYFFE